MVLAGPHHDHLHKRISVHVLVRRVQSQAGRGSSSQTDDAQNAAKPSGTKNGVITTEGRRHIRRFLDRHVLEHGRNGRSTAWINKW